MPMHIHDTNKQMYNNKSYVQIPHRSTGCFDDRLLTMMTDTRFYVPWRVGYNFRLENLLEKPSGTLWWMSTLIVLRDPTETSWSISLANKATMDHLFRGCTEKSHTKRRLSVQVVRLKVKVGCLHLYTIKLLSFIYISAKFQATVWFYKVIGAHQRWQVEEKWPPLSTDQFRSDDRSWILVANIDDGS